MKYAKYHALGNDYVVLRPTDVDFELERDTIKLICHRNYGIGSDGILFGPIESEACDFGLKIYNPDGSETEISGNGLRIFARFLLDQGLVIRKPFTVETSGGPVTCEVLNDGKTVKVQMGEVSFKSTKIPVTGPPRLVLNELFEIKGGLLLTYCAASIGNPHCVVLWDKPTPEIARRLGPLIESDPRFPKRTNVQFMRILDRNNIKIEIWERGAGYILASGSSATAAAAVARKLDFCDEEITVHMPGGTIHVSLDETYRATMTGPVVKICDGRISDEMFAKYNDTIRKN